MIEFNDFLKKLAAEQEEVHRQKEQEEEWARQEGLRIKQQVNKSGLITEGNSILVPSSKKCAKKLSSTYQCKDCFLKFRSKHSSNTLLSLL